MTSDWWVYIVRCGDGTLYTGIARDLAARLESHNAGRGARYTRSRRPVELVYSEPASSRGVALRREADIRRRGALYKRALAALMNAQGSDRSPGPAAPARRQDRSE